MREGLIPALIALQLLTVSGLASQEPQREDGRAVLGAVMGAYSGGTLGLVAALEPCSRITFTLGCARLATAAGAAVGLASGAVMGRDRGSDVADRARSGAYGAVAGAAVGLALQRFVQPYGWTDALTLAAVGGAIGTVPRGSLWGVAAGGSVGLVLWRTWPSFGAADAAAVAFVGLAVGGLADWVARASEEPERTAALPLSISIPVGR